MEKLLFDSYVDFSKYIYSLAEYGKAVSVVAFGNEIAILAKQLLTYHDVKLGFVNNYDNSEYTDYDGEYYLALDSDLELSIERVFGEDDRLIKSGLDVGCYFSDVHSKIALNNEDEIQYEIEVEKDCCDVCGCAFDDYVEDYDSELEITKDDEPMLLYMICEMLSELLDKMKE